jgi:hypothetical protein
MLHAHLTLGNVLKTRRKYVIVLCPFVLFPGIMSGSDNAAHFFEASVETKRRLKRRVDNREAVCRRGHQQTDNPNPNKKKRSA